MSLQEHLNQIVLLKNGIQNAFSESAVVLGFDLLQSVQERVQTEGKDNKGSGLKPYSDAYLKFKKNPTGKRAKDLGLGSSRYSGVVDYTLTGRMWNNAAVNPVKLSENKFVVSYGFQNDESNVKAESLVKRDGFNILEPSEGELSIALEDMKQNIQNRINQVI